MATLFYQTAKFRKLQKEWYEKLAKKGFKDIEAMKPIHTGELMGFVPRRAMEVGDRVDVDVQEYYRASRCYLHHGKFQSALEHHVWEFHCEGISYRNMLPLLRERGYITNIWWISKAIQRINRLSMIFNVCNEEGIYFDVESEA